MSSFSARRAACRGAAPPNAIIVRSPSVAPISMAWTRAALAMFSPTISLTPSAATCGSRSSGTPIAEESASVAAFSSSAMRPARELGRVDAPHRQDRRRSPWARCRPGRSRPAPAGRRRFPAPPRCGRGDPRRRWSRRLRRSPPSRSRGCGAAGRCPSGSDGPGRPRRLAWSAAGRRRSGRSWRSCLPCRKKERDRARIAGRRGSRRRRRPPGPDSTRRMGKRIAVPMSATPPPDSMTKSGQAKPASRRPSSRLRR